MSDSKPEHPACAEARLWLLKACHTQPYSCTYELGFKLSWHLTSPISKSDKPRSHASLLCCGLGSTVCMQVS